ncbi:hypothetical protein [Pseudonocardia acidicola]|nr:hypothetical protein [Pseudonocardia acidicola]
MTAIDAGEQSRLPLTGERTVPGIPEENYWLSMAATVCVTR